MLRALILTMVLIAGFAAPAAAQEFRRFLLPVSIGGELRGANGAVWRDLFTVANVSQMPLRFGTDIRPGIACGNGPCVPEIPAGEAFNVPLALDFPRRVPAVLFHVRSDSARPVGLSLRISSRPDDLGTQLPIVSEEEFRTGVASLMIVHTSDERYRTLLRLYDPDAVPGRALRVRAYALFTGRLVADRVIALSVPEQPVAETPFYPGYAEVAIDQAFVFDTTVRAGAPLRLEVEPVADGQRFWAMATMTSNATNQFLLVTPEP